MDIKHYYTEKGNGKPLILLHGNGEDSSYFIHQMEYFSKNYRVIAVDTRGHGRTPRGNAPFTIRQFAKDLYYLMDDLKIKKADILGFSDGGNIAMIFAMMYPDRLDHLILNGANLCGRGVKLSVQVPIVMEYYIAQFHSKRNASAKKKAELLGLMVKDPNIKVKELKRVTVPTLVIAGTNDMIRTSHTKKIARNLPNAKLVLLSGDHFIANKQYQKFNHAVECFLNLNFRASM